MIVDGISKRFSLHALSAIRWRN